MFGGKREKERIREIEEKLKQAESLKADHDVVKKEIQKAKDIASEVFVTLESGDAQLEKDLAQMAEVFLSGGEEGRAIADVLSKSGNRLAELAEIAAASISQKEEQSESEESQSKAAEAIRKIKESEQQIMADIREQETCVKKGETIHQQLKDTSSEMKKSAKNMGVLALRAAIEAGRLGEAGKEFIQAAEDVRKLSETYDASVAESTERITELEEVLVQQQAWIEKLMGQLSENEKVFEQLAEEPKEDFLDIEPKEDSILPQVQILEELKAQEAVLKDAAHNLEEHFHLYENSIRQIEAIEENYKETAKSKNDLEERLEKLYQKSKINIS